MSRVLEQKSSKQEDMWQTVMKLWQKACSLLSVEKSTDNKGEERRTE